MLARRRSGLIDHDVLWTFAQGFSLVYERLILVERLQGERARLHRALGSAEALAVTSAPVLDLAPEISGGARGDGDGPMIGTCGPASGRPQYEELTERESQVLGLLALGATNARIADELVISESTVKSHVRHILRKVGAVNRAQAISRYLAVASG